MMAVQPYFSYFSSISFYFPINIIIIRFLGKYCGQSEGSDVCVCVCACMRLCVCVSLSLYLSVLQNAS